jgi:outer membrane beta-barrel protein
MNKRHKYRLDVIFVVLIAAIGFGWAPAYADNDPLAEDLEGYWSTDRDLQVVESKLFSLEDRFATGLFVGLMSSEPFHWYVPAGLRLSYFLSDHLGFEAGGQFMDAEGVLTHDTEITEFLTDSQRDAFDRTKHLEDRFLWRANAAVVWNPIYGKISFLNNKLSHVQVNLALGAGVVGYVRPDKDRTKSSNGIAPELVFGPGVHFFIDESWLLRIDGRFYVYQGPESPSNEGSLGSQIQVPSEFLLGTSYFF